MKGHTDILMKLASVVFDLVQSIEPDIPEDCMEGYEYDDLVIKGFDFLTAVVKELEDKEVLKEVYQLTLEVFEGREEYGYYEDRFEALLGVIEERI